MKTTSRFRAVLAATLSLAFIACTPAPALAQKLTVGTGSPTGTYSKMLKEITSVCNAQGFLGEANSSGSMENVDNIVGNKINAGMVQTDVLHYRKTTEDLSNVKTLLALHPEEVHLVALNAAPSTGNSILNKVGLGDKSGGLSTVNDLAGKKVGAVGGSFITAQVIRLQAQIAYNVVEFGDNKSLLSALHAKQIDAALLVGGSPLGAVAELKGDGYKLLSFTPDVVERLKSVYRPATLNYQSIGARGIPTVATDALFVTREYKTAGFVNALSGIRSCVQSKLDELKETTGTHPKWQAVSADNKGKWAWYELPSALVPPPTKVSVK